MAPAAGPAPSRWSLAVVSGAAALGLFVVWCQSQWLAFPYDLEPGEGNHVYFALRLWRGEPLYVASDGFPYLYDVYPPVYPLVLAPLLALLGPHILVGRLVSLAAAWATAALAAAWLRREGAGVPVQAAIAAAVLAAPTLFPWLSVCRNDALALALVIGALVVADRARHTRATRDVALAAGLALAAAFTRQSHVLLGAAVFAPLARPLGRRAWLWGAAWAAAGAALLALGDVVTGGRFLHALWSTVAWTGTAPFKWVHLSTYLVGQTGLVALAGYALVAARTRRRVPPGVWWSLPVGGWMALEITRVGAAPNYFLVFHVLLACLAGFAARDLFAAGGGRRAVAAALLLGQLGADAAGLRPHAAPVPPGALERTVALERHLRGVPGPLLLDRQTMLWLYLGQRDHFVEVSGLGIDAFHGTARLGPLEDFVSRAGFGAILLRDHSMLPEPVRARVTRHYRVEARVTLLDDVYTLYRPRGTSAP